MKRAIPVLVILCALISVAAGKFEAQVGFDRDFDFSSLRTFDYRDTIETSVSEAAPPVHEMIKLLIIKQFKDSGLELVEDDPDILVTYHTSLNDAMRMNTTLYQYHFSAGWWWSPYWGSGMDIASYSRGTLIIDAWDPDTETLIWRGAVIGIVPENPGPEKARKTIEKALNAIAKEWRKQYKKVR